VQLWTSDLAGLSKTLNTSFQDASPSRQQFVQKINVEKQTERSMLPDRSSRNKKPPTAATIIKRKKFN